MIQFRKLHGLGNDFILLDGISSTLPVERLIEESARLCHRQLGVGADGLVLLLPAEQAGADVRMRIINADGSEPEMCGNGIRCLAKVAHDRLEAYRGRSRLSVQTGAGLLHCELTVGADGQVSSVRVDMGKPSLDRASLPMTGGSGPFLEQPIEVRGRTLRSTAVSMGNPHLVTFVDEDPGPLAATLGPELERHPLFPRRTNVEFARTRPGDGGLDLAVWERGCGLTLACGTGACATAVAAVATGRHPAGRPLAVALPGGTLTIEVAEKLDHVWMDGPAVEVFEGRLSL